MAKTLVSALSLVLVLSSASAGSGMWQRVECDITRINAQRPSSSIRSQGGFSEYWDHNSEEFQCAGVSLHRHTIRSRGLMLPAYHNAPLLAYVLQGRGILGVMISGCPETFESPQQQSAEGERFTDRHQQVEYLKEGDVVAIRAGDAHWTYNSGDQDLIIVVVQDNTNNANQLDQNPRSFMLAGNPERAQQQEQEMPRARGGEREPQHEMGNVFRGFSAESLAEVFGVDEETARKLKSENDERGMIVIVERGLQVIKPPYRGSENGMEETVCSTNIRQNIDKPSQVDVYNPQAGRLSSLNSFSFPLLNYLQLSFTKGLLHRNAIMAPYWLTNAHSILYITRGDQRIQVVNHNGQPVFDGQVPEGQVLVVPQNFAVIKQAGERGCEWVEFRTNDNAMINTLVGRTSALRGLPLDVVANSYQISREDAKRLKTARRETLFFTGTTSSSSTVASA